MLQMKLPCISAVWMKTFPKNCVCWEIPSKTAFHGVAPATDGPTRRLHGPRNDEAPQQAAYWIFNAAAKAVPPEQSGGVSPDDEISFGFHYRVPARLYTGVGGRGGGSPSSPPRMPNSGTRYAPATSLTAALRHNFETPQWECGRGAGCTLGAFRLIIYWANILAGCRIPHRPIAPSSSPGRLPAVLVVLVLLGSPPPPPHHTPNSPLSPPTWLHLTASI